MSKVKWAFILPITIICGLLIGSFLGMTAPNRKGLQSMKRLSVNDLPEHGLLIVDESDPSFDSRLLGCLKSSPSPSLDILKQFSVFVINNSSRPVAALAINWEFIQPDGRAISKYKAVSQPNLFHTGNPGAPSGAIGLSSRVATAPIIEPHSSRLVSLLDATAIKPQGVQLTKDRTDVPDDVKQKAEKYTSGQVDQLNQMIEKSVNWSVSIDGVFFEDGTFVGPDKTGFFDKIKAQVDARFDLLTEIATLMAQPESAKGNLYETVFKYVQSVAGSGRPKLSGFAAKEFYKHKKSTLALQILTNRKILGDERAIDFVREQLKEPHIQVTKQ